MTKTITQKKLGDVNADDTAVSANLMTTMWLTTTMDDVCNTNNTHEDENTVIMPRLITMTLLTMKAASTQKGVTRVCGASANINKRNNM